MLYAHAQGIGASELEGGELGCRVLPVVDGKLRQPQPICPMVLFIGTEEAQVLLHFSVHNLRLAIRLWVMCCGELGQDTESLAEVHHDLRGKMWALITNDGAGKAMILPDVE